MQGVCVRVRWGRASHTRLERDVLPDCLGTQSHLRSTTQAHPRPAPPSSHSPL
jgi:hypothetical protein